MADPLSILGLAADAISALHRALRDKISLAPGRLSFGGSDWQDAQLLTLTSQSDKPLYNVVVGVWSDDRPVLSELPLSLEQVDGCRLRVPLPGREDVALSADWFGIHGRSGAHGVLLITIRQLDAHQTMHLGLKSDAHKRFHVFTEVLKYESAPSSPAFSTKPNEISIPLNLPIDMTMTGFTYYIAEGTGRHT